MYTLVIYYKQSFKENVYGRDIMLVRTINYYLFHTFLLYVGLNTNKKKQGIVIIKSDDLD